MAAAEGTPLLRRGHSANNSADRDRDGHDDDDEEHQGRRGGTVGFSQRQQHFPHGPRRGVLHALWRAFLAPRAVVFAPVSALISVLFCVLLVLSTYLNVKHNSGNFGFLGGGGAGDSGDSSGRDEASLDSDGESELWLHRVCFWGDALCFLFVLYEMCWLRIGCGGMGLQGLSRREFASVIGWRDRCAVLAEWGFAVELLCLVGVVPAFFFAPHSAWLYPGGFWRLLFCFRFLLMHDRLSRLLDVRYSFANVSIIHRQVIRTYLVIVTTLLTATAVLQASTWIPAVQSFHDTLFFVVLTLATIGYPDTSNAWGRLLLIAFIFALTLIVPEKLSELVTLMAQTSSFSGSLSNRRRGNHVVVVTGDLSHGISEVLRIINELSHEDHGLSRPETIVILAPCEPPSSLLAVLNEPEHRNRVVFLKGSGMSATDTRRAGVDSARACFLLTPKSVGSSGTVARRLDAATVMRVLRINANSDIPTFAEILDPTSRPQVLAAGANSVLCVGSVSMSLLGMSVSAPGASTLITNLARTEEDRADPECVKGRDWHALYDYGASSEIYSTTIPSCLAGFSFSAAARRIFRATGATLVAVVDQASELLLQPGQHYCCVGGETCLVIAQDDRVSRHVARMKWAPPIKGVDGDSGAAAGKTGDAPVTGENGELPESVVAARRVLGTDSFPVSLFTTSMTSLLPSTSVRSYDSVFLDDVQASQLSGHILIVRFGLHLARFAKLLHQYSSHTPKIVVLDDEDSLPSREEWRTSGLGEIKFDVWLMIGDPISVQDLARAGATRAESVVVLNSQRSDFADESRANDLTVETEQICAQDSAVVMSLLALKACIHASQAVQTGSPPEGGNKIPSSLFQLREITNATLLGCSGSKHHTTIRNDDEERSAYRSLPFATGMCFSSAFVDSLLSQQYFNPLSTEFFQKLLWGERCSLTLIELSNADLRCSGGVYRKLLAVLSKRSFLLIGLYRRLTPNERGGAKLEFWARDRYVVTNPPPDTEVRDDDQLFVITPQRAMV